MPGGRRNRKKGNNTGPSEPPENDSPTEDTPPTNTAPGAFKFDFGAMGRGGAFAPVFDFSNPANNELLNAMKTKLGGLVGKSSGYMESLPEPIRHRVQALKHLHKTKVEIDRDYKKARDELEKQFGEKYAPLFSKRASFVNGALEPTEEERGPQEEEEEGIKIEEVKDEKDPKAKSQQDVPKGIPEFWSTAMFHHEALGELITEKDMEALKFLTDVRVKVFQDFVPKQEETPKEPKEEEEEEDNGPLHGFTLEFSFSQNPFFEDAVLSKTYYLSMSLNEEMYHHAEATEIKWKEGKNLTIKKVTKQEKPKKKGGKRGSNKGQPMKTVVIEEPQESFFNFFSPEGILGPMPEEGMDEETEDGSLLEEDYQYGLEIKEALVPNAILYYTGEAQALLSPDFEFEGEDEGEDEEGEDEEFAPGSTEKPAECKQQ